MGDPYRERLEPALLALALALAAAHVGWASASDPGGDAARAAADRVARGRILFRIHCASCHGSEGRGDGRLAQDLLVPPADLTRLAEGDDGFPVERVTREIDGRLEVRGHGGREMPVWGLTFRDAGRDHDQEAEVAEKIRALVEYLETLQPPVAPKR